MYVIASFITKHRGSIKYAKYLFPTFRQHGSKQKKPSSLKIFASSSSVPAASLKSNLADENPSILHNKSTSDVLGTEQSLNVLPKPELNSVQQNVSSNVSICPNGYGRPVSKPDVIIAAVKCDTEENISKDIQKVRLLNVIKPSDLEWHKQTLDIKLLPRYYMSLAKIRLTGLVVLTTLAGYGMAPGPFDPGILLCTLIGTSLISASANAINQFLEIPYDSQMSRTKNRVLVRGQLTPLHAFGFATCSATLGLSMLYFGSYALTAALGATNLVLYTSIYTPLKRCSILNTWVGSVVGAIPPLMGWSACTGSLSSSALLMGAILYSWQFPHFNALSWNLRPDYSRAGYRMTSVVHPDLCRAAALRHSIAILFFCSAAPLLDLTTWTFAFDSLPLNCYFVYCAYQFYKNADSQSSRKLFRLSLIHLPALMLLMFIGKKHLVKDEKNKVDN